jgi:uncharacterized RDD family membrane protein YckC
MSDAPPPPPPGGDGDPSVPPLPPGFGSPAAPPPPQGPSATPPPPGGYPQQPPPPGGYSQQPPPPGAYGAPQPPGQQFGQPSYGYQPPAAAYQYGTGLPSSALLASPGKRIGGWLIDFVIVLIINIPVVIVMFLVLAQTSTDSFGNTYRADLGLGGQLLINLVSTAIWAAYHIGFVAAKGQTPGAMLVKVKIVRLSDGQIPGAGPATMRVVPNLVGLIPCLGVLLSLGLWIWALVNLFSNERRQTPFDLAAKTVVIEA